MKKSVLKSILIPLLVVISLAGVLMFVVVNNISNDLFQKNLVDNAKTLSKQTSMYYEEVFQQYEVDLERIAIREVLLTADANPDIVTELFVSTLNSVKGATSIYMGTPNKLLPNSIDNYAAPEDFDPTSEPWYIAGVEAKGEVVWSEPLVDKASGEIVVVPSKAIYDGDKLVGVLAFDISVNELAAKINDIHFGNNGYVSVHDATGTILIDKNTELIGKNFKDTSFFQAIKDSGTEAGNVAFVLEDIELEGYFVKSPTTGWTLMAVFPAEDFKQSAKSLLMSLSTVIFASMGTIAAVLVFSIRKVLQPIKTLQASIEQVEKGDFSIHAKVYSKNEIGRLTEGFNQMIERVRGMIVTIETTAKEVNEVSSVLIQSSKENQITANEISNSMEQISNGAGEQAHLTEANSASINTLDDKIQNIERQSNKVKEDSSKMSSASDKGADMIVLLREKSQKTNSATKEMVSAIYSLDANSTDIGKIISTIAEIAEQSNLLALNAAIEAARAGESGRGFAVVADEVRKLAEKSAVSSKTIADLISKMQNETKNTVRLIEDTHELINEQELVVNETEKSFNTISGTIDENTKAIETIVKNIQDIISTKDEILTSTKEITDITQETAASTEEISASVEEQSASMEQLYVLAEKLGSYSDELMNEFRNLKK